MVRYLFLVFGLSIGFNVRAERVLVLGDSLSMGAFSTKLKEGLEGAGHSVYYYASSGGNPYYWLDTTELHSEDQKILVPSQEPQILYGRQVPKMNWYFEHLKPQSVVVQAGNNLFYILRKQDGYDRVKQKVEELVSRIVVAGGARCFWILAPQAREDVYSLELQQLMEKAITEGVGQSCLLFKSREVTKAPIDSSGDGIHYGPDEYRSWAEKVSEWLASALQNRQALRAIPLYNNSLSQEKPAFRAVPIELANVRRLQLVEKSHVPDPREFPYSQAMVIYRYIDLDAKEKGRQEEYLVKHFAFRERKITPEASFNVGDIFRMSLLESPEELETIYTSDDFFVLDAKMYFSQEFERVSP